MTAKASTRGSVDLRNQAPTKALKDLARAASEGCKAGPTSLKVAEKGSGAGWRRRGRERSRWNIGNPRNQFPTKVPQNLVRAASEGCKTGPSGLKMISSVVGAVGGGEGVGSGAGGISRTSPTEGTWDYGEESRVVAAYAEVGEERKCNCVPSSLHLGPLGGPYMRVLNLRGCLHGIRLIVLSAMNRMGGCGSMIPQSGGRVPVPDTKERCGVEKTSQRKVSCTSAQQLEDRAVEYPLGNVGLGRWRGVPTIVEVKGIELGVVVGDLEFGEHAEVDQSGYLRPQADIAVTSATTARVQVVAKIVRRKTRTRQPNAAEPTLGKIHKVLSFNVNCLGLKYITRGKQRNLTLKADNVLGFCVGLTRFSVDSQGEVKGSSSTKVNPHQASRFKVGRMMPSLQSGLEVPTNPE
ncbi:hypothetical protein BDN72DRAFT_864369 [Pluteus cervinus]|uniref:Uncharacterized protein n=1 Tax=Pluteus cervinus TaxID=181527 RepID=A0ACD3A548_9AGAR|nr:hypothetical protein BDN72DRAFT_864369 [Pluteus cervinus]